MNDVAALSYYKMKEDVHGPVFATAGSACFDIYSLIEQNVPITVYDMSNTKIKRKPDRHAHSEVAINIQPADRILIPTGLIFDIPKGHSVRLHTRSSISLKKGLIMPNGEGIIDSDYYHQTFDMLYNAGADEIRIENNERIAQGELIKTCNYQLLETTDVPEQKTDRIGGLGSTGK